jgi:hypothetical protein
MPATMVVASTAAAVALRQDRCSAEPQIPATTSRQSVKKE